MPEPQSSAAAARPTQNDVARRAGVSRATVSYVLNGQANGRLTISPETQARVLQAVAELGYVPDAGAQALRSGSTQTIGLIIPDLRNPHFWQTAEGIELEARAAGYRLLLSSMELDVHYGEEIFKDLSSRRIDALILMGCIIDNSSATEQTLAHCIRRRLPIVEIGDRELTSARVDCIVTDYRAATVEMMAHLLALGHRRIGFIYGVAVHELGQDRLVAYREALEPLGLYDPALIVECGPDMAEGRNATWQLLALREPPTAIIAINDQFAIAALRAITDAGLRVPQDISLAGFDDITEAQYLVPRLSTATKDAVQRGREAVQLILRRLQQPDLPHQRIEAASRFIARESTAPAPRG